MKDKWKQAELNNVQKYFFDYWIYLAQGIVWEHWLDTPE